MGKLPDLAQLGLDEINVVKSFDSKINRSKPLEDYFELCESDEHEYYNHWQTTGWVGLINLDLILSNAIEEGASDIHLTSNQYISYTILGEIEKQIQYVKPDTLTMEDLVDSMLSHQAKSNYVKDLEWDTSYTIRKGPYQGRRFRVSVGKTFDSDFLVFRTIPDKIPSVEELGIEQEVIDLFDNSSGAVLVCGATGSGKATHKDTLIVTKEGLKKAKDVKVGDEIYDMTGSLTKVIDLHYADETDDFYRVVFHNGVEIKCSGRHLWFIQDSQYIWRAVTTDFIYENPAFTFRVPKSDRMSLYKGLSINDREQLVDNYLNKNHQSANKHVCEEDCLLVSELASSLGYSITKTNENKIVVDKDRTQEFARIVFVELIMDNYEDYVCFEVDSASHSYLFSEMFFATHNSTTMSSILRDIQIKSAKKIITIEKPVEVVYPEDGKGLVIQRAVPEDCLTFENGLTSALRQNPDYILIGEVRNQLEVNEFLRAAETGHLAMSTIHTVNNVTTLNRIRSLFSGDEQKRILATLGDVLRGIVNQVLVKSIDGYSRFAVREVLIIDYKVRQLIAEDKFEEIRKYQEDNELTMEHQLVRVYLEGKCTLEEARGKAPDMFYFDEILDKKEGQ